MGPLKYFFKTSPVLAIILAVVLLVIALKLIGFIFSHILLFVVVAVAIFLFVKFKKKK